jgi:hypothetical protein
MAHQTLTCPYCKVDFTHRDAPSDSVTFPPPNEPEMEDCIRAVCPNCDTSSVYRRSQLTYYLN